LINLGEQLLEKEKEAGVGAGGVGGMNETGGMKTERQIWWFVARTILAEAGQEV
jgi:hypothetical protein